MRAPFGTGLFGLLVAVGLVVGGSAAQASYSYDSSEEEDTSTNSVTSSDVLKNAVQQTSGLISKRIAQFTAPRPTATTAPSPGSTPQPDGGAPGNGGATPGGPTSSLAPGNGLSSGNGGHAALLGPGGSDQAFEGNEQQQTVHLLNGTTGLSGGDTMNGVGVWASASHSWMENDLSSTEHDGSLYTLAGGADYQFSDKLMGGVALSGEWLDLDTAFNDGYQEASGLQVTPYGALMLMDGRLVVDAMAGYGWTENDVARKPNNTEITGSYDSTRWMLNGNATYYHTAGPWTLSGKLGYLTAHEEADAYTESNGNRQSGRDTTLGEYQLGGKAAYRKDMWEPYASATFLYDGVMTHTTVSSGEPKPANDDTAVEGVLGLNVYARDRLTTGVELTHEFLREDSTTTTLSANVRWEF